LILLQLLHESFPNTSHLANEADKIRDGQDWSLGLDPSHPIGKLVAKLKKNWGEQSQEVREKLMLKQLLASRVRDMMSKSTSTRRLLTASNFLVFMSVHSASSYSSLSKDGITHF
jgi:hypothetical protein